MKFTDLGYGDPATWGSCKPYSEVEIQPVKLTPAERKKRSDAWVNHRINQYLGKTHFSRALKDVLFGATKSQQNRFFYECRRRGVEVKMREILFRGFSERLKMWAYGCGCGVTAERVGYIVTNVTAPNKSKLNDVYANAVSVNSESIGQFTGLTDKNGVKIFENDVVKSNRGGIYQVVFDKGMFKKASKQGVFITYAWDELQIIGNVFENPELVEV